MTNSIRQSEFNDAPFIKARRQASAIRPLPQSWETDSLNWQIEGLVLVIGEQSAFMLMTQMQAPLSAHILLTDTDEGLPANMGHLMTPLAGRKMRLKGHLGAFEVVLEANDEQTSSQILQAPPLPVGLKADFILDLQAEPLLQQDILPLGYFAPQKEELDHTLETLERWVGTFSKPRYVVYDEALCVHKTPHNPGLTGCQNCIEACPVQAISSKNYQISVDDGLCQGCGHCTSACSSGALRYHYPPPANQLDQLRQMLNHYHAIAGSYPRILFHQNDTNLILEQLPLDILPFAVHSINSTGLEIWFAALSFGANQILLAEEPDLPEFLHHGLRQHIKTAHELLQGLGYPRKAIRLLDPQSISRLKPELVMPAIKTTRQIGLDDKRQQLFFALDHLYEQSDHTVPANIELSQNHGIGVVKVDPKACTLCTQCVELCPVNALQVLQDTELYFYANRCVQCELCMTGCPEQAISLESLHISNVLERREPKRIAYKPSEPV